MISGWKSCLRGSWLWVLVIWVGQDALGQGLSRLPPTESASAARFAWVPNLPAAGAHVPSVEPMQDLSSSDWSAASPASGSDWSFRTCHDFGALLYFQTEAIFLSQGSSLPASQFRLTNAPATLSVPAGTLPSSVTFFPPPNNTMAQSTYNPYAWNWVTGTAQTVNSGNGGALGALDGWTSAPRLTLGLVFDTGFGLQLRYWTLEEGSAQGVPFSTGGMTYNGSLQSLFGAEQFRAQTVDFELTKDGRLSNWELLGTFGLRHAQVDHQRFDAVMGRIRTGTSETGQTEIPNINQYSTSQYTMATGQGMAFDGAGLTFSLQGLRPFLANPAFAFFATARGSALFGETNSWAQSSVAYSSAYGSGMANDLERLREHETLTIAELQAGLQWCPQFDWSPGRFFFRAAVEYQYWRASGGQPIASATTGDRGQVRSLSTAPSTQVPANATSVVGGYNFWATPAYLGGVGTTGGTAVAQGGLVDLDLIGLAITAGWVY